ncbi:hypothetical protein BGZ81_002474 [Podila clonocystis]|nr:hypothetical protein BGZ81_002474 [Podila clonocystis]
MRNWDLQSTKHLKEFGCDVLRETVTIAHNRIFEVSATFRRSRVFFGGYTGETEESYVLIMEHQQLYTLPRTKNCLQKPFKGLIKPLRIKMAVKSTIEAYHQLHRAQHPTENVAGQDQEAEEADLTWMTEDPVGLFDPNVVVASSPLGSDDLPPDFGDQRFPDENDGS